MPEEKFTWVDLPIHDLPGARTFYGEVFGWSFRSYTDGYMTLVDADGQQFGSFDHMLAQRQEAAGRRAPRVYVRVQNLEAVLDKVVSAGGEVVKARMAIEPAAEPGWWAVIRDADGLELGLWTLEPARD